MRIIDAQIHLWSKGTVVPPHRTTPYLLDEAMRDMDAAGVHGAVIHPPSWDPDSHALALEAARLHPDRFAILGRIPLDQPEKRGQIETWRQQPGVLGLRYTFLQPHMKSWPTDGTMDWLWPAAERLGLPVALLAGEFLPLVGADRRAASAAAPDRRPLRREARQQGRRGLRHHAATARAGEASQHRGEDDRRAAVRDRPLSVQEPAEALSRHLRRVRAQAHVLGHRHHPHALHLGASASPPSPSTSRGCPRPTSRSSWAGPWPTGSAGITVPVDCVYSCAG